MSATLVFCALVARATSEADLEGVWINAFPANHSVPIFGTVRWDSFSFSTNGTMTWQWERNGVNETNSGKYRIDAVPIDKPGYRQKFNISINPTYMAVWRPITLSDVTTQADNRFPAKWIVLKWYDEGGKRITFLREEDYKKWRNKKSTGP